MNYLKQFGPYGLYESYKTMSSDLPNVTKIVPGGNEWHDIYQNVPRIWGAYMYRPANRNPISYCVYGESDVWRSG